MPTFESVARQHIVPVLIGSGANAYELAYGFYTQYQLVSFAVGPSILLQCKNTQCAVTHQINDVISERFAERLNEFAEKIRQENRNSILLLIPCGDTAAEYVAQYQQELMQNYELATCDSEVLHQLTNKWAFTQWCIANGIPVPETSVYTYEHYVQSQWANPEHFPVVLKASDSVSYLDVQFDGRKKLYILNNVQELNAIIRKIYQHGYRDSLVIQQYIAGSDAQMITINGYVNTDHSIAMLCLGRVVMEEKSPDHLGYYAAIVSDYDKEVYELCTRLISQINYRGYINIDIKRDTQTGQLYVFEINPRPGGSSGYVPHTLARWIYQDLIEHQYGATVYMNEQSLWLGMPYSLISRYAPDSDTKELAKQLFKTRQYRFSAWRNDDMNIRRRIDFMRWKHALKTITNKYGKH